MFESKQMSTPKQLLFYYPTFFVNGLLAITIGSLMPFIRDTFGLEYAFAGLLVSLHSVGNLFSSFVAGVLPIWLGKRKSIIIFVVALPVAATLLALTQGTSFVLMCAFFCTGVMRGAVSNFNNAAVNEIAKGKAWALNALHASFAVGAFVAPFLMLLCTKANPEGWRTMCWVLVLLGAAECVLFSILPIANNKVAASAKGAQDFGFLREKQFYISTGTLFFYLCAEQGVIGWMVTYFKDSGLMSAAYAQVMASVLWILILAGRLSVAFLSTRLNKSRLLGVMGVGFVVFFFIIMFGKTLPVITLGIAGFGFSMAGIYPTTVSLTGSIMKKYPLSWSVILTAAGLGAVIMPAIMGVIAEKAGITAGMMSVFVVVMLTLGFIIANMIQHKNET